MTTRCAARRTSIRMMHGGIAPCFCLLVAACRAETTTSTPKATRVDSAGVEIVTSSGTDHMLAWKFEPTATISSDSTAAGVFNPRPELVLTDGKEHIYALDTDAKRVLVFDDHGKFVRASGRGGGGPGEMGYPLGFSVATDGTVGVFDISKRRLVRFGPGGEIVEEVDGGPDFTGGGLYLNANGSVLHDFSANDRSTGKATAGIHLMANGNDSVIVSREMPAFKPIELKSCGMQFSGMPPLFVLHTRWSSDGTRLAYASTAAYDIVVTNGAGPQRIIRRDVPPRAATKELAMQELGKGMEVRTDGGVRKCASADVVEQRGFEKVIPAIGNLIQSPTGELWVQRGGVKGEQLPIDVFAADGAYIGTLPSTIAFPSGFLSDGRAVIVHQDENDQYVVTIFRIRR